MRPFVHFLAAITIFVISVALGAVGGGFIGREIAVHYPGYYRSMFPTAVTRPFFDCVEVGVGTGIGQGAVAGLVVGGVLVLASAIAKRPHKVSGN